MMQTEFKDRTAHAPQDSVSSSLVAPALTGAMFKEAGFQVEIKASRGF